jgi:hypothetical protein
LDLNWFKSEFGVFNSRITHCPRCFLQKKISEVRASEAKFYTVDLKYSIPELHTVLEEF